MAEGNHEAALEHLRNGLQILQNRNTYTTDFTLEREAIAQVFRRLDTQATVFMDSRQTELNATSNCIPNENAIPDAFSSLHEARISLEGIEIGLLYILTTKSSSDTSREILLCTRRPLLQAVFFELRGMEFWAFRLLEECQSLLPFMLPHRTTSRLGSSIDAAGLSRDGSFAWPPIREYQDMKMYLS